MIELKKSEEEWADIKGFEGFYQVSNFGRIRSLDRVIRYSNGATAKHKGVIRRASVCEYRMAVLSRNNKICALKISRLVALNFVKNPNDLMVVNHIDGNKLNDHFSNLEWCTYSRNSVHAFEIGLSKKVNKTPGVFYESRRGLWAAYIYRGDKNIFVGRVSSEGEAAAARSEKLEGLAHAFS